MGPAILNCESGGNYDFNFWAPESDQNSHGCTSMLEAFRFHFKGNARLGGLERKLISCPLQNLVDL